VVLSQGVNDGAVLERTLEELYGFGASVLNVSAVPVGLTTFSKHHLVREATRDECRAAIGQLEGWAERARKERGITWAFGADELYLRGPHRPPRPMTASAGREGQVCAVAGAAPPGCGDLADWRGRHRVVTGRSMAGLMQALEPLGGNHAGRAISLGNPLFGDAVTCAGLLPARLSRPRSQATRDLA
jgi:hypothetical protein